MSALTKLVGAFGVAICAALLSHGSVAQVLIATPASIDFGNALIGSTSTQTVTFNNFDTVATVNVQAMNYSSARTAWPFRYGANARRSGNGLFGSSIN